MGQWSTVFQISAHERIARNILDWLDDLGVSIRVVEQRLRLAPKEKVPPLVAAYFTESEGSEVKAEVVRLVKRGPWLSDQIPTEGSYFMSETFWDYLAR